MGRALLMFETPLRRGNYKGAIMDFITIHTNYVLQAHVIAM